MTWQRVHIRIVSHPRLEVGKVYEAERDENGHYYVVVAQDWSPTETLFPWEAEEVVDEAV